MGVGEGVRKVGRVQLGRAAAAYGQAQRTGVVCGCGTLQAKTQSATRQEGWGGGGGCHNLQEGVALARLL